MANQEPHDSAESDPGRRISKVIHDVNNQLLVISFTTAQLLDKSPQDAFHHKDLIAIQDAGKEIALQLRLLQDISRRLYGESAADQSEVSEIATHDRNKCGFESEASKELAAGSTTLLVVDDDAHIRQFVKSVLDSMGYQIIEARHGPAAISTALRHAGPIHLLVTDLLMPEMTGREVAEALRASDPNLPVLYLSGENTDAVLERGNLHEFDAFLQKPFKAAELLLKVREILEVRY